MGPSILGLQHQFCKAVSTMIKEKSAFSVFAVDNLEKLLISQHKIEKDRRFKIWLQKMNDLDFHNRTRAFFSEIRSKYSRNEEMGPIYNKDGELSSNTSETLENWSEYYKNLYSSSNCPSIQNLPTPDSNPTIDDDLAHTEFVDVVYELRNHKCLDSIVF